MEVQLKFQVKFYDIIDHNKCPSSKKSAEKCILRKSFFHHSEPKYGERDAVCAVCGRLQRTIGTNILYLLCSKSQNELNSNSKFYLLLDLFLTCIKHIDMWLHISFRRSPFHNMHLYVLLTLIFYWNYWNYDSIM